MSKPKTTQPDVRVEKHGSLFLFQPLTGCATDWINEHIDVDSTQFFGGALVVEYRYASDLATGMLEDGLILV